MISSPMLITGTGSCIKDLTLDVGLLLPNLPAYKGGNKGGT